MRADGAQNVRRALHRDGQVAVLFLDLVAGHGHRAVVRHGGGHDQHIGGVKAAGDGFVQILCGGHRNIRGEFDRRQSGLAVDEGHVRAPHGGGAGQCVAHLAGGMVGQVAHGVQCLLGGPGGHGDTHSGQVLGPGDGVQDVLDEHIFLRQATTAHILAGQHTALGGDDREAIPLQRGEVVLRDGVFQHAGVHGGGNQLGAFGRQHHGGEHIVGDAVGHFGDHVGRGGGHQDHVGLFGQRDVGDLEFEVAVKGVHHALVAGQGLKGDGSDELGGVFGHDDLHIGPQLAQCAGHIGHLIGGNAAGDAQKDAFAL